MQEDWQRLIEQTVQDEALRSAYVWEPFARGSSNSIFLGKLKSDRSTISLPDNLAETVVLRINAPAKDTPGVSRLREANILNLISPHQWAPKILRNDPEQGWCLMQHYAPISTTQDTPSHLLLKHQKQLLAAIDALQAIPVRSDALEIDYPRFLDEIYLPMASARHDELAHARIQSIKDDLAALPKLPNCLVHHDIHLGNLVLTKPLHNTDSNAELVILDWEYAAIGNPWFDASCLSRYLSLPPAAINNLGLFKTFDETTFNSALALADSMTETLQDLWYWARE